MKKIPLLFLSLSILMTAQAQILIPKVGVSYSKVKVEISQGMKPNIGLTFGVAYNHQITEMFSLQPELNFIQKGFRQEVHENQDGTTMDGKGKFNVNYLELPILAKVLFGEGNVKFYLNAGPSLGIGLGGKYKADYTVSFLGNSQTESFENKIKFGDPDNSDEDELYLDNRLELSLQSGFGIMITDKIMIDFRYGHALSSMTDDSDDEAGKIKNRVFQLTVGYPIRLK
jgi:hypothetical protein